MERLTAKLGKIYTAFKPYLFLLIAVIALVANVKSVKSENKYLDHVEIIHQNNRDDIKSKVNHTQVVFQEKESRGQTTFKLPENEIVRSIAYPEIVAPKSITEIVIKGKTVPEMMIPNGAMGILTQGQTKGWECERGDRIEVSFEKYRSEVTPYQTLVIGYVKDGMLYEGIAFTELKGKYHLDIKEKGEYHIYYVGAASDYLSLNESKVIFSNCLEH